MADWSVVLLKIAAIFSVILVGYASRRRGLLDAGTTLGMSRLAIDVAFPCLVFGQMLRTVTAEALAASWFAPITGAAVICVGELVGLASARLSAPGRARRTFVFLVAITNWVYLPLPIAEGLFGDEGVREVLLFNVGAQAALWTLGVWTLRGAGLDRSALRDLALNPGLLATAAGVAVALAAPGQPTGRGAFALAAGAILDAVTMIGSLTIPVSLLVTGSQLGGLETRGDSSKGVAAAVLARLVVAPLATIALVRLLGLLGAEIPRVPRMVAYLISAMPAAVSCSIFTERFGGDTALAARVIFWSTLASVVTVPALCFAIDSLGL